MKKIILSMLFLIPLLLNSCVEHNKEKNDKERNQQKENIENMRVLLMSPDSLRTEEDNALLNKLEGIVYERCIIKNDKLELTMSREEWEEAGLKDEYYDMLQSDIRNVNNFIDTTTFSKQLILDSYEKARKEYQERDNSLISD